MYRYLQGSAKFAVVSQMMLYSMIFLLSACGGGAPASDLGSDVGVIDYRSAYIFEPNSEVNKLLIGVSSRLTVNDSSGERSYLLLREHPRESTFDPSRSPYLEVVSDERGASFISFIYGVGIDSVVVSRRYSTLSSDNEKYIHECRSGKSFEKFYRDFLSSQVFNISADDIYSAPRDAASYFGSFEYSAGGANLKIDFPVSLINFNPDRTGSVIINNLLFQVVSNQVPIYLERGISECDSIVPGYLAFRSFDGQAQAVYLCKYLVGNVLLYDYGCVVDIPGKFRLFRSI